MIVKRNIIEIDENRCTGCGQCVLACAEGAIEIVDGKAKVIKESFCDGLGACIGECPEGALKIIEREADVFDPDEVEGHLKEKGKMEVFKHQTQEPQNKIDLLPCGCPSTHIQIFHDRQVSPSQDTCQEGKTPSELTHWPVQIRLVPPSAAFLKDAHLLIAADCTAFAYTDFHRDFLKGRICLIGCPKFDDTNAYIERLEEIFMKNSIKDITVLIMEVPCCSKLPVIVKEAINKAGKNIPLELAQIGASGNIMERKQL